MTEPSEPFADYPQPRFRAAVLEQMAVHEDLIPALVHVLRLNGVEPTIFLNSRIRQARPGLKKRFPELTEQLKFVDLSGRPKWRRFWRRLHDGGFDLLVMNSYQTDAHARTVEQWGGPALGVVHNSSILTSNEVARSLAMSGRVGLLTLAPHVTANLMSIDPRAYRDTATITFAFPHPPRVRVRRSERRTIALPGSVNHRSRDYGQVLDALPQILERVGAYGLQVSVVGGSGFGSEGGEGRARLEREVAAHGLEHVFHFAELNEHGFVPGGAYYGLLRGADFIVPAMPADDPSFRTRKISSAIPAAIGINVPPVIDRWTAAVYGVPSVGYAEGSVADGIARAATMPDDELLGLRAALADFKEREFARAADEMGWALSRLELG